MGRAEDAYATRRSFFGQCSAGTAGDQWGGVNRSRLPGVEGQGDVVEQRLKRPAAGQVEADAAGSLAHAGAEFEQACTQGFDLRRAPRLRELKPKQIDEVVGEAVQEQAEGIGQETVAAQPVSAEAVLELLDTVLALAPIVVEPKMPDMSKTSASLVDRRHASDSALLSGVDRLGPLRATAQ